MNQPDINDWRKLYESAVQFQKLAPWDWMYDDNLFAVENPDTGEMAYVSIMGNGRNIYGLGIFLGEKGYRHYLELVTQEPEADEPEKQMMTPLLSFLLVSRKEMDKEDMAIINSLGLKFRVANAWPSFRSQRPGFAPWFLEKEEALFMTDILERTLVVSQKVMDEDLDLEEMDDQNKVLTCFFRDGRWLEEWRTPKLAAPKLKPAEYSLPPVKEAELLLWRNSKGKLSGNWEMDIFMLPFPIGATTQRPHYPLCFLTVDKKLGIILDVEMTEPWISISEKRENVLKTLHKVNSLPSRIYVKSESIREILEPLAAKLGIQVVVGNLTYLKEARAEIEKHLFQSLR